MKKFSRFISVVWGDLMIAGALNTISKVCNSVKNRQNESIKHLSSFILIICNISNLNVYEGFSLAK